MKRGRNNRPDRYSPILTGWRGAAKKLGVELAMLIDERGEVYVTQALKQRLEFQGKSLLIHEIP